MSTTVEVLAPAFKDAGTPFIVGHPGGKSVELMEAARQRQMRFLLMKQEVAGAMLAATWGDITGSPGICLSTRGPGATNMVNGVAHAFLDRSPLIAITDSYSRPTYETGLRQRINQLAIYEPIVKWSTTIDAKTVRQQVRRAMRTATGAPPGPVHFEFPQSETTREAGEYVSEPPLMPNCEPRAGPRRPQAGARHARRASGRLIAGRAGRLLVRCLGGIREICRAARRAGAHHHQMQGHDPGGSSVARRLHHRRTDRAQAGERIRSDRHRRARRGRAAAEALALYAARCCRSPRCRASMRWCRPIRKSSATSSRCSRGSAQWAPEGADWGEKAAKKFREQVRERAQHAGTGLSPQRAMEVARAMLPRNTIATCDAGASRLLVVQKWESYGPREFLTSNGLASMGYAVPGALAARMAIPTGRSWRSPATAAS